MNFFIYPQFKQRKEADFLIIPFWEDLNPILAAEVPLFYEQALNLPLQLEDFKGKEGESLVIYVNEEREPRLLMLGLGKKEKISVEVCRKAYANATRLCQKKKAKKINLLIPKKKEISISEADLLKGIAEGVLLTNYKWDQLKGSKKDSFDLIEEIGWIGLSIKATKSLEKISQICESVYFARDLINGNADEVTPQFLAEVAVNLSSKFSDIKTTVLNKKQLEAAKMGLLLAVGRGSDFEPKLIILEYKGNPSSTKHTVIIGKGVTYDTGGLNLKPTGSMETMRDDMSGAAAVMATIAAAASIKLKTNVTAVIAAAENAIDGKSFKPGDVYKSYSGKTVEIGNTDAEGRLTLADAISYSIDHLSPTQMIDLATLTGSMVIALGEEISGIMSNDETLASQLLAASELSSELLWRLPLHDSYRETLKSDIADLKNVGGRAGGAIIAGLFIQEFVKQIPWAHIDIAGTAFNSKDRFYSPKNGVGFGVRLLIEFLEKFG